jgi:hypothetical protein
MVKNSSSQNGSAFVVIIIILVVAIVGALGFVVWQNYIKQDNVMQSSKTDQSKEPNSIVVKDSYTFNDAVTDINTVLSKQVCGSQGPTIVLNESDFSKVDDTQAFDYQGGKSFINEELNYAYVQYGCGSQGSVALLKRIDDAWKLISDDARVYPMCEVVRGEGFPISIVDKCYEDDRAAEPVAIKD